MIHPQYQVIDPEKPTPLSKRLTPVYPTTKGLSQTKLRQIVGASLKEQLKNTEEILPDEIIAERLKTYQPMLPDIKSGYQKMYVDHVMQADKGADLDFLVGKRGSEVKRHSH